jgi:hypothetical protein
MTKAPFQAHPLTTLGPKKPGQVTSPKGFLIVHDYSSLHWPGAEQAVDEFFADKPENIVLMLDISGSIIVRKQK